MEKNIHLYLLANLSMENFQLKAFINDFEKKIIVTALKFTGGHQKMSADILGIKPTTFFEKLKRLNLKCRVKSFKRGNFDELEL